MIDLDSSINERWRRVVVDRVKKGFYGGTDEMKLSNEERTHLHELGYSDTDVKQIEEVMQVRYTTYTLGSKTISRDRAIELLGRKTYLSGIVRSAFHWSAVRITESGENIYFDSSKYFKL